MASLLSLKSAPCCTSCLWRGRLVRECWIELRSILKQQHGDAQGSSNRPDKYHERHVESPLAISRPRTLDIKFDGNDSQITAVAAIEPSAACTNNVYN